MKRNPFGRGLLMGSLVLAGCAVGPDFKTPAAPETSRYTPAPMVPQTASAPGLAGAAQSFHDGADVAADWWSSYQSPELDALVKEGIAHSPTLAAAAANLKAAQAEITVARGPLFPSVSGSLQDARERLSPISTGDPFPVELNVAQAALNFSYSLDVFGATRRNVEASQAQAEYQNFELEAAYLTMTASIVTTAVKEASLRAQIEATHEVLDAENHQLDLIGRQFKFGAVSKASLLQQQALVASTQATLPPLDKQLAQTRHLLATLVGRLPSDGTLPEFTLEKLHLPTDIPVTLPSQLVRQRPDLRASEAQLHEASAQVGVATANLYPQIALSASYGREALDWSGLFKSPNTVWSLGAGLTQPIFEGGALRAKKRSAEASYEAAAAQYRATVLTAFENVADSLRALDTDAEALKAVAQSESVSKQSLELSQSQYKLGALSFLQLLQAETQYQQARVALAQAQATRLADSAALFQSLGGGWWNRTESIAVAQGATAAE